MKEISEAEEFKLLLRQFREQVAISHAGEETPNFNSFDESSSPRQAQMIHFAYILHMRIQYALGTKKIHRSLDAKVIRMHVGEELNRESINEFKQQRSGNIPPTDSAH